MRISLESQSKRVRLGRVRSRPARLAPAAVVGILVAAVELLVAGCSSPGPRASQSQSPESQVEALPMQLVLYEPRQLTFEGLRSGEGYFDREGAKLVFQSERAPGNPFYQIYLLDLETGDIEQVSPGVGKATCGWIHPGGGRVLFASTHLDPDSVAEQTRETQARSSGTERRYEWDFDEHYDLFTRDLGPETGATNSPRRLTTARGYDAEAAWSPDGSLIVFASNRHAYEGELSEAERARFASDPSVAMEIYTMDARGGNLRRLTESPGYDGGPFFSPNGGRIVWRRFSEDGATAEIFTMKVDGSDVRQITRLGAMSWAPFYHPSGDYIIFTSNLQGFGNFELYMVDAEGSSQPLRVTRSPGFDGLPAFAPGGQQLAWTSQRAGGRSQLFLGAWDDALARKRLGLPALHAATASPPLALPERTRPEIDTEDLRAHVNALASDVAEGRLTGTAGERYATSYVARAFRGIGLEPAGDAGSYFQEFGFTAGVSLGERNRMRLVRRTRGTGETENFAPDRDWRPYAFSRVGDVEPSEVVFAGYGIVAPPVEAQGEASPSIDPYQDLDVRDRWVLVFRYSPEDLSAAERQRLHRYSSVRYKAMLVRDRGARGILVVSGPNSRVRNELAPLRTDVSLAGASIAALSISDALASRLLRPSGRSLADLQRKLDNGEAVPGFVLPEVQVEARVDLRQERRRGRNVLGRVRARPASDAPSILIGAHVDHLGRGEGANSLAHEDEHGQIHAGADDNASGVAVLLEIAQHVASMQVRGELELKRDLVFAAWSGEELGLLGSSHFANTLGNPHSASDLGDEVAAYLNLDMVGRLDDQLLLFGVGSSTQWPGEIERRNIPIGLAIATQDDSYLRTDATSLYVRGVPILSAFTGAHEDYHTPRDLPERLNYAGMRDVARLIEAIGLSLAERDEPPDYVATPVPGPEARAGLRVYLGTIPDYSQTDRLGVTLAGVKSGGPADRAGARRGDMIVRVGEQVVENIYDYTYALEALTVGETVELEVMREAQRVLLQVTPTSRD